MTKRAKVKEPIVESEVESEVDKNPVPVPAHHSPNAKMRRAFDDLDIVIYKQKRNRRHKRQRFVRALRKLAGLCASCGGPLTKDDGVTCARCLAVDKAYKGTSKETEGVAKFCDEFARPMKLRFTPKMLPVIGPRYDGSSKDWPECIELQSCLGELIRACGQKDSAGASCPKGCEHFVGNDPGAETRSKIAKPRP